MRRLSLCLCLTATASFSQTASIVGSLDPTDAQSVALVTFSIINTGAHLKPIDGFQNGNLCVNVYAFSPDEQMASCCSCLVTPNGLASLSVREDLVSNTLTPSIPSSITVALIGTDGGAGGACGGSYAPEVPGLLAFGSTLHPLPGATGAFGLAETPFSVGQLNATQRLRMNSLCAFLRAYGSGYGICKSCKIGGLGASKK